MGAVRREGFDAVRRWCRVALFAWICLWGAATARADIAALGDAVIRPNSGPQQQVNLPAQWHRSEAPDTRISVQVSYSMPQTGPQAGLALYIPYLFDGGDVRVNGQVVLRVPQTNADITVRWRKPFWVPLPDALLRNGVNTVELDLPAHAGLATVYIPKPSIALLAEQFDRAESRKFWVHGVNWITLGTSIIVTAAMSLIWWRTRSDAIYLWMAIAGLLWGIRTALLLVEVVPTPTWLAWRTVHHFVALGSTAALVALSLQFAQLRRRRWIQGAWAYSVLVPVLVLLSGGRLDQVASSAGYVLAIGGMGGIAIGCAIHAVRIRGDVPSWVLLINYCLIALAAVHDLILFWRADWMYALAPHWVEQCILLLRYTFSLLMLTFVVVIVHRYSDNLRQMKGINQVLEARVRQRETELAEEHARVTALQRQQAMLEERQRIMHDLHDGLGSQLLTTLTRARANDLEPDQITAALQACLNDLRLALDTLRPDAGGFWPAFADFRFRWSQLLAAADIAVHWDIPVVSDLRELPPHATLQVLRILQEALTNVIKHAAASHVHVRVQEAASDSLVFSVEDNGKGMSGTDAASTARAGFGLESMQQRARRLGAHLLITNAQPGTRVELAVPVL